MYEEYDVNNVLVRNVLKFVWDGHLQLRQGKKLFTLYLGCMLGMTKKKSEDVTSEGMTSGGREYIKECHTLYTKESGPELV